MARYTTTNQEVIHISKISEQLPIGGIAEITLNNGRKVEGVIRRIGQGNNAGQGGWKYYGEVEIQTINEGGWVIDYLEISSARNIWSEVKSKEFEDAGLIIITR